MLVFVVLVIACAVLFKLSEKSVFLDGVYAILGVIAGILSAIVFVYSAYVDATSEAEALKLEQQYAYLTYRLETIDELEWWYMKEDVYEDVVEWNADISYRKKASKSWWIGVFYPNIYDRFELIEWE